MGVHHGDNVSLDGDGRYAATIRIGAADTDVIGSLADRWGSPTTVDLEFEYDPTEIDSLERTLFDADEGRGDPGALEPMGDHGDHDLEIDAGTATRVGVGTNGDVVFPAAVVFDDRDEAETHALAVAAETRYNRYPLVFASLTAAVFRDGDRIAEAALRETVDGRRGHHYRTVIDPAVLERGDDLAISFDVPPQVARHEGYETAFLEPKRASIGLGDW